MRYKESNPCVGHNFYSVNAGTKLITCLGQISAPKTPWKPSYGPIIFNHSYADVLFREQIKANYSQASSVIAGSGPTTCFTFE